MKTRTTSLLFTLALLTLPIAARADGFGTLTATSGVLFPDTSVTGAGFLLYGNGFSLTTPLSGTYGGFGVCGIEAIPNSAGIVTVSTCNPMFFITGGAQLTIAGSSQDVFYDESTVFVPAPDMTFVAGSPLVVLSEPMSISGFINVCSPTPGGFGDPFAIYCPVPNELMGTVNINASGTFTSVLAENPDGSYSKLSDTYSFAPIATPEPASLGLLLLGLTGIAMWKRNRRTVAAHFD